MAQGRRVERVASLIRREVSELLISGIRDERVQQGMVTITEVVVSGDLQHCKIFVSIYGKKTHQADVLAGLHSASGFLRGELARRLAMRRAPEVVFKLDQGLEKGTNVIKLLDELEHARESRIAIDLDKNEQK